MPEVRHHYRILHNIYCALPLLIGIASICSSQAGFLGRNSSLNVLPMSLRRNINNKSGTSPVSSSPGVPPPSRNLATKGGGSLQMSNVIFDNGPLWQATSIFGGMNALGFVISLLTGSHVHLDLIGSGAFSLAALPSLVSKSSSLLTRVKVSSAAVAIWGAKLAGFLFFRALKLGHDARLDDTLSTVTGTFGFWFLSFLWGVLCSLPHTLGTTSSGPGNGPCLAVGTTLYAIGLVAETLADYQKWTFKQTNPGQFCNVGLWSVSQHPNFFGNLVLWFGIFVINAPALIDPLPPNNNAGMLERILTCKRLFIALLSPAFMWALFYGQASGSVTNAVEMAQAKYGADPAYKEYIETVPLIVPNVLKKPHQS